MASFPRQLRIPAGSAFLLGFAQRQAVGGVVGGATLLVRG
jgi:hypothetical protein